MVKAGLGLLLVAMLAGCSAAPARKMAGQGPTFVSLNPCTDAILAEVADPAQILALSSYSRDPDASSMNLATARRFRMVGGTVEEVMALRPDVVLDGTFTGPATRAALERGGFRLEQVGMTATIADSAAQIRRLAALAGHPDRGEALVARIDTALAAAAPPPGPPVTAVVWQSGGIVPGKGALISDLLRRTGFRNAAAERGLRQADLLPLEQMLADPPRVILTAGSAHAEQDRLLRHPALAALKNTRLERFDPALLWCGGPTIIRAAQRLAQVRRSVS